MAPATTRSGVDTAWSIELAVELDVVEWGGQPARVMLEEDAFLVGKWGGVPRRAPGGDLLIG